MRLLLLKQTLAGILLVSLTLTWSVSPAFAQTPPPSHTYYIHQDHLGSIITITDETGNPVKQSKYLPYGEEEASNTSINGRVERGYTGQITDSSTTLSYYNARYYDPVLSRFISADSVSDGMNRYAYVGGNPINAVDPTGNMMWAGGDEGGGVRKRGRVGSGPGLRSGRPVIPGFNLPPTPNIGYTRTLGVGTNVLTNSLNIFANPDPEWAHDVSDIVTGSIQAGMGMLMGPGKAMIRDWDLFWNTPGGVAEKAFLATDFVMMGGLWGYGEWSAKNRNASFGERLGQAVLPGLQITAMLGPKVVPVISKGVRNIYWQNQFNKSIAAVERSGVNVFRLHSKTYEKVLDRIEQISGSRQMASRAFYLSDSEAGYYGLRGGIYMNKAFLKDPLGGLSDLLHEYTHSLTFEALNLTHPYYSNPGIHEVFSFATEAAAPYLPPAIRDFAQFSMEAYLNNMVIFRR